MGLNGKVDLRRHGIEVCSSKTPFEFFSLVLKSQNVFRNLSIHDIEAFSLMVHLKYI